jgi:hypothetical protein
VIASGKKETVSVIDCGEGKAACLKYSSFTFLFTNAEICPYLTMNMMKYRHEATITLAVIEAVFN